MEVLVLIRSIASILIVASSFVIVTGQAPEAQKTDADKAVKTFRAMGTEKLRDIPFPAGVDLQFLIKELARDLDLNVLFDIESFRTPGRRTYIELKNVTAAAALDYILLQDGLFFEEAGPKTILVANRAQRTAVPQIGIGVLPLTEQLAQYFGVDGGILINAVRDNSPASKVGLTAGDVIVEIDGVPLTGPLGIVRAINDKNESDVILTIVRNRKRQTISVTPRQGIKSVL
jgi:membrane-associated protease RseP (regulator of RpoE activity)